jgi:PAS domain-containing protein
VNSPLIEKKDREWADKLMQRVALGDLKAFGEFYDRFANDLFSTALTITGSGSVAQELVHDALICLLRNAGNFKGNSELARSWMALKIRELCFERMGPPKNTLPKKLPKAVPVRAERNAPDGGARRVLESITDAFFSLDQDWRFTYLNLQSSIILDRQPSELLGKVIWDEYPGLIDSVFEPIYRISARDRVAASITSFYPDHNRWYAVNTFPAAQGLSVYFCDKSKEMQLAGLVPGSGK